MKGLPFPGLGGKWQNKIDLCPLAQQQAIMITAPPPGKKIRNPEQMIPIGFRGKSKKGISANRFTRTPNLNTLRVSQHKERIHTGGYTLCKTFNEYSLTRFCHNLEILCLATPCPSVHYTPRINDRRSGSRISLCGNLYFLSITD